MVETGAGNRMQSWRVRRYRGKRKRTGWPEYGGGGSGGGGFLFKGCLCDVIEVIQHTNFDETIWLRVPGEKEVKHILLGNMQG